MEDSLVIDKAKLRAIKKQNLKRKKKIFKIIFILLFIMVLVFLVLSMTVFFNIENIYVNGNKIYSSEEIISLSNININDNMFRLNKSNIEAKIKLKLPYVDDVKIIRKLPNAIYINLTEAIEYSAVYNENGYLLLSKNNRVLKKDVNEITSETIVLKGVSVVNNIIGNYTDFENVEKRDAISNIYKIIDELKLDNISSIDISDIKDIKVVAGKKVILLGDTSELEYKLTMYKEINNKYLSPEENLTVNCKKPKRVVVSPIKN